jgi:peptidoglycan/LPS O-acetylase OafA/YrhL
LEKKVFFPGLDTLRAIGALSVVIGHIELTKSEFKLPNLLNIDYFSNTSGHLGVMLFYVLSGFLITYLLLKEKEAFNKVHIGSFLMRRFLRIWPIYIVSVLFIYFFLPLIIESNYYGKPDYLENGLNFSTLFIYIFMVPNLMVFGINGIGAGFHLGSIGVEEQFYLLWPFVISLFKKQIYIMYFLILFIPVIPHIFDYVNHNYYGSNLKSLTQLRLFFEYFKINSMAVGGLIAYLYFKGHRIINVLFHPIVEISAYALGFGGWLLGIIFPYFTDEIYSLLFAIIIVNSAVNTKKIIDIENFFLNKIGKISYGIYVFHWLIIYLVIVLLSKLELNNLVFQSLLYLLVLTLTILISHFSFHYFEIKFIRLKRYFSYI